MKTKVIQFFQNPRIGIILAVMAVGMVGIIGIQLYWMHNAARMEEELFRKGVNRALNAVVHSLESRESAMMLGQTLALSDSVADDVVITQEKSGHLSPPSMVPPSPPTLAKTMTPVIVENTPQIDKKMPVLPRRSNNSVLQKKELSRSMADKQNIENTSYHGDSIPDRSAQQKAQDFNHFERTGQQFQFRIQSNPSRSSHQAPQSAEILNLDEFITQQTLGATQQALGAIGTLDISPTQLGVVMDPKVLGDPNTWMTYYKKFNDKNFRDSLRTVIAKKMQASGVKIRGSVNLKNEQAPQNRLYTTSSHNSESLQRAQQRIQERLTEMKQQRIQTQRSVKSNQVIIKLDDGQSFTIALDSAVWSATGWSPTVALQSPTVALQSLTTKALRPRSANGNGAFVVSSHSSANEVPVQTAHISAKTNFPAQDDCEEEIVGETRKAVVSPQPKNIPTAQRKIARRTAILRTALERLINNRQDIHLRLEKSVVDSLVMYHLRENNIALPYRFAVINSMDTSVLIANTPELTVTNQLSLSQNNNEQVSILPVNALEKSSHIFQQMPSAFMATLFPNDLIGTSYRIMVDFPSYHGASLAMMTGMGLTSFCCISLVVGCFAWTLLALLRQKKISEVKNDFINNMTHELKTPIATISMASEALLDVQMRADEKRVARFASIIHEENKRLSGHVEKVLKSAQMERRIQAGSLDLAYTPTNISYMITDVIASFELQIASKDGTVTCALEAHQNTIDADEAHIANVVSNLIDNAIKYCGEVPPHITIATYNAGDQLCISVADHGVGIRREHLKHLFEKFYRVPTGNVHNVKGFGLGLNYVQTIVEAHGGTIHVESEFGKGSTFTLKLPLRQGVQG